MIKIKQIEGLQSTLSTLSLGTGTPGGTATKITWVSGGTILSGTTLSVGDIPNLPAGIIQSGVLPVVFGGTGALSFPAGTILRGNNQNAISGTTPAQLKIDIGLGNVDNAAQIQSPGNNQAGGTLVVWNGTTGKQVYTSGYTVQTQVRATGAATHVAIPTESAVRAAIEQFSGTMANAMKFRGSYNGGPLPAGDVGDTYVSIFSGPAATSGPPLEIGDTLIRKASGGTDSTWNANSWIIIQANIDRAVVSASGGTASNNIAIFDGSTGLIIKDSGYNVDTILSETLFRRNAEVHTNTSLPKSYTQTEVNSGVVLSTTIPNLYVNGVYIHYSAIVLTSESWQLTPGGFDLKLPYETDTNDVLVFVFNSR